MRGPRLAFFVMLGVFATTIAGGVGIFYIFDKQLVDLNQSIADLKAEQESVKAQITIYEQTRTKVEELSFVKELSSSVLPIEKEQANTVAELRAFITEVGLTFDSLTFTGPEVNVVTLSNAGTSQTELAEGVAGVRQLPASVVIGAGATYTQLLELLEKIENNQRKMQVINLNLVPDETGERFSTISIGLNIYLSNPGALQVNEGGQENGISS